MNNFLGFSNDEKWINKIARKRFTQSKHTNYSNCFFFKGLLSVSCIYACLSHISNLPPYILFSINISYHSHLLSIIPLAVLFDTVFNFSIFFSTPARRFLFTIFTLFCSLLFRFSVIYTPKYMNFLSLLITSFSI